MFDSRWVAMSCHCQRRREQTCSVNPQYEQAHQSQATTRSLSPASF